MELKKFDINGVFIDILYIESSSSDGSEQDMKIAIRNTCDEDKVISFRKTRYNSKQSGVKDLLTMSQLDLMFGGYTIPANSFVEANMKFEVESVCFGDILELNVSNFGILHVEYTDKFKWVVIKCPSGDDSTPSLSQEERILNNIERFESIEEQMGITLQNFSINIFSETEIKLFCEVIAFGELPSFSFSVEMAIYDKKGKIRHLSSISKGTDEFMGFEVFGFGKVYLKIPVSDIGKIRFYLTK